jgi:hypothetical protein
LVGPPDPFIGEFFSDFANRKTGVISAVAGEQAPGDAGIHVGDVAAAPCLATGFLDALFEPARVRRGRLDQQHAQIATSTFTDAE